MKANQVLLTLKNKGFERGVTEVLLKLAEENEDKDRTFKEMAEAFSALAKVQMMLNSALDGMDTHIKKLNAQRGPNDDEPSSTRGML